MSQKTNTLGGGPDIADLIEFDNRPRRERYVRHSRRTTPLSFEPQDPRKDAKSVEKLRRGGRYKDALRFLDASEEKYGVGTRTLASRARVLASLGRYDEALEYAELIAGDNVGQVMSRSRAKASVCLVMGDLDEARAHFKDALGIFDNDQKSLIGMGIIYLIQGMLFEAREKFEAVLENNPESPSVAARYFMARIFFNEGKYAEAIALLEKLMRRGESSRKIKLPVYMLRVLCAHPEDNPFMLGPPETDPETMVVAAEKVRVGGIAELDEVEKEYFW